MVQLPDAEIARGMLVSGERITGDCILFLWHFVILLVFGIGFEGTSSRCNSWRVIACIGTVASRYICIHICIIIVHNTISIFVIVNFLLICAFFGYMKMIWLPKTLRVIKKPSVYVLVRSVSAPSRLMIQRTQVLLKPRIVWTEPGSNFKICGPTYGPVCDLA